MPNATERAYQVEKPAIVWSARARNQSSGSKAALSRSRFSCHQSASSTLFWPQCSAKASEAENKTRLLAGVLETAAWRVGEGGLCRAVNRLLGRFGGRALRKSRAERHHCDLFRSGQRSRAAEIARPIRHGPAPASLPGRSSLTRGR